MDDGPYGQVLHGLRSVARYLRWYWRAPKTCLQHFENLRFVRCEYDTAYVRDAFSSLLNVYAKNVFGLEYDIACSKEVLKKSMMFVKEKAALTSRKSANCWNILTRLVLLLVFPVYIMHFPTNAYKDVRLFETFWSIPLLPWSESWCGLDHSKHLSILPSLDMSYQVVTEKKAAIHCSDAELDLFSSRTVDGGNIAGCYKPIYCIHIKTWRGNRQTRTERKCCMYILKPVGNG